MLLFFSQLSWPAWEQLETMKSRQPSAAWTSTWVVAVASRAARAMPGKDQGSHGREALGAGA